MEHKDQNNDPDATPKDVKIFDINADDRTTDQTTEGPQLDVHISREFIQQLQKILSDEDTDALFVLLEDFHAADVADILEVLASKERLKLIELLGSRLDPEVLIEIEGEAQDDLYENIPNEQIADAVNELETDDAVYVLEELDDQDREEVLKSLAVDDRVAIEESLSFPEDSAGRLMQRDLVALPEFWTVGQTIDYLRSDDADVPDDFYDIFVVDPGHKPVGSVPLSRVMRTGRDKAIGSIMDPELYLVDVKADQEEVAYQFTKYHLISAAVIDESRRLVGVITVDDVVDVIEEEAEEDILALAGVGGDTALNENIREITKSRFTWLLANLGTAILASAVIGFFDATIEQMVALAVLMPIVASMGGNAGTQTMTVAVRALATKELGTTNALRNISREVIVAGFNGVILALISGVIAWLWFDSIMLGGVFAAAMIVNMLAAGLFGILVPLAMQRSGIDPAIASSVFVTTITDVVGFFAFLGLAALFLLQGGL
ncbi:magnesium transporter [Kordiimonas sp. SCSIO 12610]|uniref:magnesium transporter n=1 Tax=Kordiimonas sp. SCSIO 12610 TaxID=2829597 RepID=UPI00210AA446|nr:magnesium transporter [Kordiimonas sp. SCSIO 12610]UTW54281.1 magnesium transporter [Kordiimonas sp. SCSIO 12610]